MLSACSLFPFVFLSFLPITSLATSNTSTSDIPMTINANLYEPAPAGLTLEHVSVYVRHGERTPVGVRLNNPPANIPEFWDMCKVARQFNASVLGKGLVTETQEVKRVVERRDGSSVDGECMLGELTDIGRESTFKYGQNLREIYVKRLGFLPDTIDNDTTAYFRSTNMPRTIESLQQVIHGLYPTHKFINDIVPRIRIRHPKDENLMGNAFVCARLKELMVGFERAAALEHNPKLEALDSKVSKYLDGNPIRVDGKPRASGILDTIRAAKSHGYKVPSVFDDPGVIGPMETAIVSEWFDGYKNEEVRKLALGRLLGELDERLQRKATEKPGQGDGLKIVINSCHDTSLAGLCQTLDVFDGRWPEFTASITFELYKAHGLTKPKSIWQSVFPSAKPSPEHYVRMRYQNRSLALPLCAKTDDHLPGSPELCKLSVFAERVKELVPQDWDAECAPTEKAKGKGWSRDAL